ncbi:MAG: M20/M25/M40 family metallo-hydrolase [Brevundimonas sp.]|uniref:M20/M25/M40 family metallo-hydrolase n=1 Tax=Brevundimonas sp. TaxID=1871086 RepID=UPI00271EF437|nr:M20/M25/M40 family metallo-hydrolase [Brevundimonas sp.]MDO9077274.1 M20/M25/M40 family metallo-hydrolase [Brevundimonas sp.]MDP3081506.1 M20/M25/M40 family metallo-hydrolase [Brevundimonas sp.]MDZ4060378.1 M20/M25/M40 family metallo-hydrolase [Brevundimonas sp.]
MRLLWLVGSLALALLIAVLTLQVPAPAGADAPATAFSAERAMVDIREIAQRPHPVGSADHARVQAVLLQRMAALGLQTSTQTGALSPAAVRRLEREGGSATGVELTNLIGVLPGRDPRLPAVALMAHYDTVPDSAGAADDSTGVAAILEAVRAIRARGPADRTLVVILTDGEELNLDGARAFWGGHPLRDRIGAVVNLEARGGGGRAMMFETGRGNAETIALFARAGAKATGGVSSNSLAVFVYEAMPNGTDFTIPKDRGVQGVNLAFIGRPEQYHAPVSTADALDQGSVQHIGSQALETADALLRAPALPAATANIVYADLFGRVVVGHAPVMGWGLLGLAFLGLGVAVWRARSHAGLTFADAGRGAVDGLWFLSTGLVLTQLVRLLAGPLSGRAESADAYYTLLARLPWMEAGAALTVLAVALALFGGRTRLDRRIVAGVIAVAAAVALILGGLNPIVIGAAVIAAGLSLFPGLAARSTWGGWTGLIGLILILGTAAQALAPEAAFLFVWTGLLAALAAALAAVLDPGLTRPRSLAPAAVAAVPGAGWIMAQAHTVFLGIGMDLPGVLVLLGLLILMLIRPLSPGTGLSRPLLIAAAAALILGGGLSVAAQVTEPMIAAKTA